jgi:hypothetical protein
MDGRADVRPKHAIGVGEVADIPHFVQRLPVVIEQRHADNLAGACRAHAGGRREPSNALRKRSGR